VASNDFWAHLALVTSFFALGAGSRLLSQGRTLNRGRHV
jgi:hypothetical protein